MNVDNRREWRVAQLGARMHYAVPRILEEEGRLQMLYTDLCSRKGLARLGRLIPPRLRTGGIRRLVGRDAAGVPSARIRSFDLFGLEYERRRRRAGTDAEKNDAFVWGGVHFCKLLLQEPMDGCRYFYTFNTAGMELLEFAGQNRICGVVEQTIAPKRQEMELLARERERFPDWERSKPDLGGSEAIVLREAAEWKAAKMIVCGSTFVRDGILACGGPAEKCVVVPYGTKPAFSSDEVRTQSSGKNGRPLRVLTVGGVELRKGAPYTLEVARRLKGVAEFRLVGAVHVPDAKAAQLQECVQLNGAVPRSEMAEHFRWADVFFLPSVCEGSATVTYEAFNAGLPVLCTPNTGSIVEDGVSGFLIPTGDVDQMVDRLHRMAVDADLRNCLSDGARIRGYESTITAYGKRLLATLNKAANCD